MQLETAPAPGSILLVDDEEQILFSSSLLLKSSGMERVITLGEGSKVIPLLQKEQVSIIVLDLGMPDVPGQELLSEINYRFPHIPVIIMTAVSEIETAVVCMRSGAFDYLTKPVQKGAFLACIRRAIDFQTLKQENKLLRRQLLSGAIADEEAFAGIVTANRQMRSVFQYMEAVAGTADPLLITGETGTGKELIVRAVHRLSGRKGNLIAVNAAGLEDTVFSDTIFGHKKGAYTGADGEREGLIARAAGGTLFLDEIGDLQVSSQVKLLRLLQEREYFPLGADLPRKTDARIIVATNRDVQRLAGEGTFRNDLYYRLCSHHIQIPPLRERRDDLPLLLDHFLQQSADASGKKKPAYPPELITLLATCTFPGNVRELKGMVDDAIALHKGGVLSLEVFNRHLDKGRGAANHTKINDHTALFPTFSGRIPTFTEAENYLVDEALRLADGNQGIAARMLGVTRQALNKRLHKSTCRKG